MKIYDTRIPIHETPGDELSINESIDKLEEMLNQYNIDHYFALPSNLEIESDKKPLVMNLYYCSEQNTEITLIVTLFAKLYLKKSTVSILQTVVKSLGNNLEA